MIFAQIATNALLQKLKSHAARKGEIRAREIVAQRKPETQNWRSARWLWPDMRQD